MMLFFLVFCCYGLFGFAAASPTIARRGEAVDNPTAVNFLRRVYHTCKGSFGPSKRIYLVYHGCSCRSWRLSLY